MPIDAAAATRELLGNYIQNRIVYYSSQVPSELMRAETAYTTGCERRVPGRGRTADAGYGLGRRRHERRLQFQGFTLAAWRNRLPVQDWELMFLIALGANFLVGYGSYRGSGSPLWFLPLSAAIAFLLIAEIDSPRSGLIRVQPENLIGVAATIGANSR